MERQITTMARDHVKAAVELAQLLWGKESGEGLYEEYEAVPESEYDTILLYKLGNETVGFIHMSVRHDYVEGAESGPTGYVKAFTSNQPIGSRASQQN